MLAAAIIFFPACKQKPRVLPREVMVRYYIELIAMQDSLGTDAGSTKLIRERLNKRFAVSSEQFDATLAGYRADPDTWQSFFEAANQEIARRQTEAIR
jgi:hypothetical protein